MIAGDLNVFSRTRKIVCIPCAITVLEPLKRKPIAGLRKPETQSC
jgi:hypothetical protein